MALRWPQDGLLDGFKMAQDGSKEAQDGSKQAADNLRENPAVAWKGQTDHRKAPPETRERHLEAPSLF